MASIVSSMGLGSGMDINGLVTKLVDAERAPATKRLDRQELAVQSKITSFGTFKSALSSFRTSLGGLLSAGSFSQVGTTSSDPTVVTASAASNADIASYRLEVKQLAQTHAVASTVYNTPNDAIGTGALTIKFGTYQTVAGNTTFSQNANKGTLTLSIDSSNNSLNGIRDAINKANAGVSAAVVYSGTGYQLVLNSTEGGAKNALQINGIAALKYNADTVNDTLTQTQAAQDAKVSINGLEVSSTTNTISTALKGVTLNLQKAQPGSTVTVGVSQGNENITKSLESFVKAYNDLAAVVKEVSTYDPSKKTQSALLGDSAVLGAMAMVRSELSRSVDGLSGSIKRLTDVGLRTQADGTLSLNSSQLNAALAKDRNAVAAIFSLAGRPSDAAVNFVGARTETLPGSYGINVTQAATQGQLAGQLALSFPITLDSSNNSIQLSVDGASSGIITLTEGTYADANALATEIQSRINGDSILRSAGAAVSVAVDSGNHLVMTSKSYGSSSNVAVTQTNSTLGLTVGAGGTDGTDIAGTIDGIAAEGKGQQLKSISGNSSGLEVLITDNTAGNRGNVVFSRGSMERLDRVLGGLLASKGTVTARNDGLNKTLEHITRDRQKLDDRMTALQTRLTKQFTAMDALVGQLQSTSAYLSQQLSNLSSSKS